MTGPEFFSNPLAPSPVLDVLAVLLGLLVGSFLNVVALRSLAEESILFPPSHCPRCKHRIAAYDNIPVLSWLLLRGKCRHCRGPIHWQYPLVEAFTAFTFFAVERCFLDPKHSPFNNSYWNHVVSVFFGADGQTRIESVLPNFVITDGGAWASQQNMLWLGAGALVLACTLIAVCITDFREKLIPHDITYPSMLIGLVFSAVVRNDLLGALAGVGASYIIFDFIAFYGLKWYLFTHDVPRPRTRRLRRRLAPRRRRRLSRLLRWRLDLSSIDRAKEEEPIEVMGGGDAVLSAVMAAFLGWQLLVVALVLSFTTGTIMGLFFLINSMRQANLLHKCLRVSLIMAAIGATTLGSFGFFMDKVVAQGFTSIALPMTILGALAGGLIGIVKVGTAVSKPYPFAPALAVGGFLAIFLLPNWLYLSAIAPTQH